MSKVFTLLAAAALVSASSVAFAGSHGGAMKDDMKKADCTKLEGKAKTDCEAAAKAADMKK